MSLVAYKVTLKDENVVGVEMIMVDRNDIEKLVQYDYSDNILNKTRKKENYILSGGISFFEKHSDKVKVILKDGSNLLTYLDCIEGYEDLYEVE